MRKVRLEQISTDDNMVHFRWMANIFVIAKKDVEWKADRLSQIKKGTLTFTAKNFLEFNSSLIGAHIQR